MKITKSQLRQIIKEELKKAINSDQTGRTLAATRALSVSIRNAIVGYLEDHKVFGDPGSIPRHTIQKIEHSAAVLADAVLSSKMETD